MSYIDKFKLSFQKKYFDTYLENKDYKNLFIEIEKLLDKKDIKFLNLINNSLESIFKDLDSQSFFPNNITWINSFEPKHAEHISKFLHFYFEKQNDEKLSSIHDIYENKLYEVLSPYVKDIHIDLNDLVQNSYLYQLMISLKYPSSNIFLKNQMAFFENIQTSKKLTHPFLANSFIYVVKNPYDSFREFKKNNSNTYYAQNYLLNLDHTPSLFSKGESFKIEINKKSWATNLESWDSEAVLRSFSGIIIKIEDLIMEPTDTYASILGHLSQAGLRLNLDYKIIDEFINLHPIVDSTPKVDISNKEIKLINREILNKATQYNYKNI